jgi:hypothetical protein
MGSDSPRDYWPEEFCEVSEALARLVLGFECCC